VQKFRRKKGEKRVKAAPETSEHKDRIKKKEKDRGRARKADWPLNSGGQLSLNSGCEIETKCKS